MNCHKCNAPLRPGAKFCVSCGAPVAAAPVTPPEPQTRPVPQQPAPVPQQSAPTAQMQQPAPQPSTPDSRIQQPTVPTVPLQPVEKTRPIYPGGIPPGYPAGAPPVATRKRGGSRLVIAGCVAAAVLLVCGGLYYAFSTDDKSTHSEWDDEETAFVEEYAEPEFSDVMLSGGSSSAPFDYTAMVCFRELTPADLTGCPKSELRLMRSTIYARHGYTFQSQDLREYFSQFDWYVPRANVVPENEMSDTELKNIALIKRFE